MEHDFGLKAQLEKMLNAIRDGQRPKTMSMDSDDLAIWLGHAFYSAGYKTRLKVVSQSADKEFHHVFVEVLHPTLKEWVPIDPHRTEPGDFSQEAVVGI